VPLVVVVSLPVESLAPRAQTTLLDACAEALPEAGSCASATDTPPSVVAVAHARGWVRWLNESHTSAFVHLSMGSGASAQTHERILRFTLADPEIERLRAIGFALGTLVSPSLAVPPPASSGATAPAASAAPDARLASTAGATSTAPTSSPPVPPAPSSPAPAGAFPLFLGLSAGVTTGAARKLFPGLEGRVALRLHGLELTLAGGATTERADGPKLDTSLVWASLGARLPLWASPRGRTLLRAEAFSEQLHAEVYGPEHPVHDFRWVPGAQVAADAEIAASGAVFVTAGFGLGVRFVQPAFTVAGREAPELGRLRITTSVGIGTRF
jgi:hypothetical protein